MEPKRRMTGIKSQAKVKGISRAMAVTPLTPGRMPKNIPTRVPSTGMIKFGAEKKPKEEEAKKRILVLSRNDSNKGLPPA